MNKFFRVSLLAIGLVFSGITVAQADLLKEAARGAGTLNQTLQAGGAGPTCHFGQKAPEWQVKPLNLTFINPVSEDFCNHPYEAICSQHAVTNEGRAEEVARLRAWAHGKALEDTAIKFGKSPRFFTDQDIASMAFGQRVDAIKFMQERVSAHLASEISTADMTAVWGNIAGVKGYLNKAIDNNLLASDPQLAQILKNTIAAVNVQSREDVIMNYYGKGDADSVEAFAAYTAPEKQGGCGNDGLVDNAFAFTTSSGKRMVIVCPGLVMSAIKGGSDSQSNFRNLIQTLAHEMGHHIDSRHAPALYAKLNQCLATNYADGLQIGSQSSLALKVGIYKDPAQLNLKKTEEHSAESTADFWATEAIVSYMDDYAAKLSTRDKLGFLREAYGAFCGTGDEGIHPDGKYRINVLLRNSLAMNRIMGCANRFPDGKAACKLWGGLVPFDRQQIQLKPILLPSQGHSARSPAPQEAPVSREAAGL